VSWVTRNIISGVSRISSNLSRPAAPAQPALANVVNLDSIRRQPAASNSEAGGPARDLTVLAGRGGSGEFICVSSDLEVHVHLQAGRIAWATNSRQPFAFTRHLQEHAQLPKEQLREALDECRRARLPLSETLVAWKLATAHQVREALRHHVSCALTALAGLARGQTVFLERAREYQHYAKELTFALAEFGAELGAEAEPDGKYRLPERDLLREIRQTLSDVTWMELLDGEIVTGQDPEGASGRVPVPLLKLTLLDGARLVTLRSARGTLIGASRASARSLWCLVPIDSTFGTAVSALCAAAGFDPAARPAMTQRPPDGGWLLGAHESSAVRELRDTLARASDLVAALVLTPEAPEAFHGVGQGHASSAWCKDVAVRRARVLAWAHDSFPREAESAQPALEARASRNLSLATAEGDRWCLGAELAGHTPASVWIFVHRTATLGLGWAYLDALVRRLEGLPNWQLASR
jgi:hypothetical protein